MPSRSLGDLASELQHPRLKAFHAYWTSKCRGELLPSLADIDPVEIPQHLAALALVDVVRDDAGGLRFRYRLIGSDVMDMHQDNNTGKWLDEVLVSENGAKILRNIEGVVNSPQPHFWHNTASIEGREHISYSRLLCPLAADGKTVDTLVAVFVFDEGEPVPPAA